MPSITFDWLKENVGNNINKEYTTFIETGTYYGSTILHMEKYFLKLHTIEIKENIFKFVKNKYLTSFNLPINRGRPKKIKFYLGDSTNILPKICSNIESKAIFFLDGHWSCGNTGKGAKDVPLNEELNGICNNFKNDCIIIIDDCRLFGKGPNNGNEVCDWEDINTMKILNIVKDRLEKNYFSPSKLDDKDRLVLFLKKI